MELFLIQALAFLRPAFFIDTGFSINLFELAAMMFSGMTFAAFGIRAATQKNLNFSATDLVIGAFVVWCIAIYLIYIDESRVNGLAKFIIPPLTYMVAKSVIPDREAYQKVLWLLIVGFSIPLFSSVALILLGGGVSSVNYWTGVSRYEGAYSGPHMMSHNAAFLLMAAWLYLLVRRDNQGPISELGKLPKTVLFLLVGTAMFLLYMGRVRTTVLGLFIFGAVLLTLHYKRLYLVIVATLFVGLTFMLSEDIRERFFPEGAQAEKVTDFDVTLYGSGRPALWSENISAFLDLPIDRQLAGVGVGNYLLDADTHNDFLGVMIYTGIVGLALFFALQLLILNRIVRMDGGSKCGFLALFAAVTVMNFVSNSYVNRFGLAQMFYLLLAYIELPSKKENRWPPPAALSSIGSSLPTGRAASLIRIAKGQ